MSTRRDFLKIVAKAFAAQGIDMPITKVWDAVAAVAPSTPARLTGLDYVIFKWAEAYTNSSWGRRLRAYVPMIKEVLALEDVEGSRLVELMGLRNTGLLDREEEIRHLKPSREEIAASIKRIINHKAPLSPEAERLAQNRKEDSDYWKKWNRMVIPMTDEEQARHEEVKREFAAFSDAAKKEYRFSLQIGGFIKHIRNCHLPSLRNHDTPTEDALIEELSKVASIPKEEFYAKLKAIEPKILEVNKKHEEWMRKRAEQEKMESTGFADYPAAYKAIWPCKEANSFLHWTYTDVVDCKRYKHGENQKDGKRQFDRNESWTRWVKKTANTDSSRIK